MRRTILERFRADHGDKRLALLQRPHIAKLLGEKKPFAARNWLKTLRGLMQFAVSIGLRSDDPAEGIKPAKAVTTGGFHSWSEEEIAQFEAKHPVGSQARLAMALPLYTAQRRSDIVRMGPQHVRDGMITIRAQKTSRTTGKTLLIPIHPALADLLAATPAKHLTFVTTKTGAPFTAAGFGNKVREWCDEAGLPNCSAHGLRKRSAGASRRLVAPSTKSRRSAGTKAFPRSAPTPERQPKRAWRNQRCRPSRRHSQLPKREQRVSNLPERFDNPTSNHLIGLGYRGQVATPAGFEPATTRLEGPWPRRNNSLL
jgi:hypothetical protein